VLGGRLSINVISAVVTVDRAGFFNLADSILHRISILQYVPIFHIIPIGGIHTLVAHATPSLTPLSEHGALAHAVVSVVSIRPVLVECGSCTSSATSSRCQTFLLTVLCYRYGNVLCAVFQQRKIFAICTKCLNGNQSLNNKVLPCSYDNALKVMLPDE
jgi:hypothetical protein